MIISTNVEALADELVALCQKLRLEKRATPEGVGYFTTPEFDATAEAIQKLTDRVELAGLTPAFRRAACERAARLVGEWLAEPNGISVGVVMLRAAAEGLVVAPDAPDSIVDALIAHCVERVRTALMKKRHRRPSAKEVKRIEVGIRADIEARIANGDIVVNESGAFKRDRTCIALAALGPAPGR
jgi:hypothetical protein